MSFVRGLGAFGMRHEDHRELRRVRVNRRAFCDIGDLFVTVDTRCPLFIDPTAIAHQCSIYTQVDTNKNDCIFVGVKINLLFRWNLTFFGYVVFLHGSLPIHANQMMFSRHMLVRTQNPIHLYI